MYLLEAGMFSAYAFWLKPAFLYWATLYLRYSAEVCKSCYRYRFLLYDHWKNKEL